MPTPPKHNGAGSRLFESFDNCPIDWLARRTRAAPAILCGEPAGESRMCQAATMSWQHIRISRFGGPEILELAEETIIPDPGPGEVRIKVLAAGTSFTDTFIRRGRYPDFKGPLPFTIQSPSDGPNPPMTSSHQSSASASTMPR
jgi:hypothetical protein